MSSAEKNLRIFNPQMEICAEEQTILRH